jgi:hypothetical protein
MPQTTVLNNVASSGAGAELAPGDHVCVLYPTLADRDDILNLYLREGLSDGDKCICVVDSTDSASVLASLGAQVELAPFLARHQLDILWSMKAFPRSGEFSTDMVVEFWDDAIKEALSGEFSFARGAGEMTWALHLLPDIKELVAFESRFNKFLPRYPQMYLCLYELARFGGSALADVLKVHPKIMLGGMLLNNPYYIEPDEFLATLK